MGEQAGTFREAKRSLPEGGSMTIERSASGKVILCGEHSVVYGRPAIAVPVSGLRARVIAEEAEPGTGVCIVALDTGEDIVLKAAPPKHPLAAIVWEVLAYLEAPEPDVVLMLRSDLPIASGLGSGTAVSVALARALAASLGHDLPSNVVSALAYEVEKIHHGTPSGIDNTVVAYEQPVYFVRGQTPQILFLPCLPNLPSCSLKVSDRGEGCRSETSPNKQNHATRNTYHVSRVTHRTSFLLIANTGIPSSTRETVAKVRHGWEAQPEVYEARFDRMGAIADAARVCLEHGDIRALGPLLDKNHHLLRELRVSHPILDQLVIAARAAGAWGAKLTGGGGGGNMIALVPPENLEAVRAALYTAEATHVWQTPLT